MYDFFIAYASPDRQKALDLCWFLQDALYKVFLDVEDLRPGALWPPALCEALEASRAIVVLVSTHVDEAFYQQEEIGRAIQLARDKPSSHTVIPVILEKLPQGAVRMPYGMSILQAQDATRAGGLKRVAAELVAWLKEHQLNAKQPKVADAAIEANRLTRLENGSLFQSRFSIKGFVGRGGFSDSYIAWDRVKDHEILIKLFATEHQPVHLQRFVEREWTIARSIAQSLPTLSTIVNSDERVDFPGGVCFVQKRIPGESLFERIKAQGLLLVYEALTTTVKLCETLAHLHQLRIAHCDIKPHNIIIRAPGDPVIIDLGTGRFFHEEIDPDYIVLSIPYSAQELISGKPIDGRVDIYSLSMTLLHMLTDQDIMYVGVDDGNHTMPMSLALGNPTLPPTEAIAAYVKEKIRKVHPESLGEVIARALSIEPADRYDDVSQFRSALLGLHLIAAT